jgi:hypothetical protein
MSFCVSALAPEDGRQITLTTSNAASNAMADHMARGLRKDQNGVNGAVDGSTADGSGRPGETSGGDNCTRSPERRDEL